MRKFISIILAAMLLISTAACRTKTEDKAENTSVKTDAENSSSSNTDGSNYYSIEIPEGFKERKDEYGIEKSKTWVPADEADKEDFENYITAYDPGVTTYEDDSMPKAYEDYITNHDEWDSDEKIVFEYNDGDSYEDFLCLYKVVYKEGNSFYDMSKMNAELEQGGSAKDFPDEIVHYYGHKTIIDKTDPSQVIELIVTLSDEKYLDDVEQSMRSFKWK